MREASAGVRRARQGSRADGQGRARAHVALSGAPVPSLTPASPPPASPPLDPCRVNSRLSPPPPPPPLTLPTPRQVVLLTHIAPVFWQTESNFIKISPLQKSTNTSTQTLVSRGGRGKGVAGVSCDSASGAMVTGWTAARPAMSPGAISVRNTDPHQAPPPPARHWHTLLTINLRTRHANAWE